MGVDSGTPFLQSSLTTHVGSLKHMRFDLVLSSPGFCPKEIIRDTKYLYAKAGIILILLGKGWRILSVHLNTSQYLAQHGCAT